MSYGVLKTLKLPHTALHCVNKGVVLCNEAYLVRVKPESGRNRNTPSHPVDNKGCVNKLFYPYTIIKEYFMPKKTITQKKYFVLNMLILFYFAEKRKEKAILLVLLI